MQNNLPLGEGYFAPYRQIFPRSFPERGFLLQKYGKNV